jgi:6-phospho-3-hexuloisomerase
MRGVLRDLKRVLEAVPDRQTASFCASLLKARRVFVYGLGRSGLVARAFGMRLVQMGRDATIVGDTTTPAIRKGDLLVVCSRTGRSPILHHAVRLAHRVGGHVVTVVGNRATPLARDADDVVRLPMEAARSETEQPMGSLFEQALLLYLDTVVVLLLSTLKKTSEDLERVHSNLP